jgi:NTE family protein
MHLFAGTSAGGMIAALYSAGLSASDMEREALRLTDPRRLVSLLERALPRRGLMKVQRVTEYLSQWLGELDFHELRFPLSLVAVDLNSAQKVVISEGNVLDGVRATMALPGVFPPVKRDDQLLVDGALLDNLPGDVVRQMGADIVIAVDISTDEQVVEFYLSELRRRPLIPEALTSLLEVIWRSMLVITNEINNYCLQESPPDLLITPDIPPEVTTISGFDRVDEIIAAGERATEEALPQLRELLRAKQGVLASIAAWLGTKLRSGRAADAPPAP